MISFYFNEYFLRIHTMNTARNHRLQAIDAKRKKFQKKKGKEKKNNAKASWNNKISQSVALCR